MVRPEIANHQTQGRPHRADRVVSRTEPFEKQEKIPLEGRRAFDIELVRKE